jgi:hypothetical protein
MALTTSRMGSTTRRRSTEGAPLEATSGAVVGEQLVLERLDVVVERLHRVEVSVHHDVEQSVHQCADTVLLATQLVEPLRHLVHAEVAIPALDRWQPHGDQATRQHECGDAMFGQCRHGVVVGRRGQCLHRVDREERVRAVHGGLGALLGRGRVLDRPDVEPELLGQCGECVVVGVVDVGPHQRVVVGETIRDGREREAIHRLARPPHPPTHLGHHPIIQQAPGHLPRRPQPCSWVAISIAHRSRIEILRAGAPAAFLPHDGDNDSRAGPKECCCRECGG